MERKICILGVVFFLLLAGCKKDWDEHYDNVPVTSSENMWEALQKEGNLSSFVNYMKQYKYDTLFLTNNTYTIFVPDNDAFSQFLAEDSVTKGLLDYHISTFFIQSASIEGTKQILTFSEKYALFINNSTGVFLDDIPLESESPVYKNGKYFVIGQVARPKPNLYEYIAATNPVLKAYIDSQDTLWLDKLNSIPIGFDSLGNTIFDTVAEMHNKFEDKFYTISKEQRSYFATIVFPKEADYNAALNHLADTISDVYTDYRDIPMKWQTEILIPYLLEHGVFLNMIEREEFLRKSIRDTVRLMNILGDSVIIDYEPGEKTVCSNGYAYNYANFEVPDTLYASPTRFEGEELLRTVSSSKYTWNRGVNVVYDVFAEPKQEYKTTGYSNDSILLMYYKKGYTGKYSVEFNIDRLFPRKYLMVVRTVMKIGGIYEFYVNDQLVKTFNYDSFLSNGGVVISVTGKRYYPAGGINSFDCWVQNLEVYGTAKIRIEYKGPGKFTASNGLAIDYINFVPY